MGRAQASELGWEVPFDFPNLIENNSHTQKCNALAFYCSAIILEYLIYK